MATRDSLALTEEQRALRDTVRGVLADQLPAGALHGMLSTGPGYSPSLHARLARELGLAGLTIPAEFGGLGLGPAEACVVHAELGHALYPGPFLASGLAAGALLAAFQAAEATVRYAAVTAVDGATEAMAAVRVAALQAGQSYRAVTEAAIQLFGGIGPASEHDAHLYYRRAWSAGRLSRGPQAPSPSR